jgi:hypothetical protein
MSGTQWFRGQVERGLAQVWGAEHVKPDCDGDYGFRSDTAMGWVRLHDEPVAGVSVFAVAAHGLRPLKAVLREVNEINLSSGPAKVALDDGWVTVEMLLPADQVNAESLGTACARVMAIASRTGPLFAAIHGGETPFGEAEEQQAG